MPPPPRRHYVMSPDLETAAGFDTAEAAAAAALAMGEGAHVIDTQGEPYQPSVSMVEAARLVLVGHGSIDARLGLGACLIEAARRGYAPMAKAFLAKGADPVAVDAQGAPALLWAVAAGGADVVRLLIETGADVGAADAEGTTALALAEAKGRSAIADMLRAAGAR